jgi:hypothetical protein
VSMRRGGVWIALGVAVVVALLIRPLGVMVVLVGALTVLAVAVSSGRMLARQAARGDLSFVMLSLATRTLPDQRRDWGDAMLAELDRVSGGRRRLRFALGCATAALLLPRPGAATQAVRIVVATTVLAITALFLYTRHRLLGASPGPSSQRGVLWIRVDLLFLGFLAVSAVTALVRFQLTSRRVRTSRLYGAIGGVVVGGVALTGSLPGLAVQDVSGLAPNDWFLLAALATMLAVGVAAARTSHDPRAGKEAGWWAGAIGGAILFTGLITLSYTNTTWFTHDPASVSAFRSNAPHFKTIAALVLNGNLDTAAMIGILVLPILGFALGALGGAASKIHDHAGRPAAGSTVAKSGA